MGSAKQMTCFECGNLADHKHHVVPKVLGGTKTVDLCEDCHTKVHGMGIKTSTLTKIALKKKMESGEYTGGVPYGYEIIDKKLVKKDSEHKHILIMMKMRFEEGKLIKDIANYLESNGVKPPRNAKKWHIQTIITIINREKRFNGK